MSSILLYNLSLWRGGWVVEGGGLLNRYTQQCVSRVRTPLSPPDFLKITFLTSFCDRVSTPQNTSICVLSSVFVQRQTRTSLSPISPFYPQNLHFYALFLRYMRTLRVKVRMSQNSLFTWLLEDRRFLTPHFLENQNRSSEWYSKRRKQAKSSDGKQFLLSF